MIQINHELKAPDLKDKLTRFWELSAKKIKLIEQSYDESKGSPVFTINGKYSTRGWTEWTQGFQFGAPLLQFDATGDRDFLELGRSRTLERMAPHVTHVGVHDHGFNNVSTYGNLWRLAREGRFEAEPWEVRYYALALKVTGAVQARRWTAIPGGGFIYSFNGAHSLFVDTIRTLRALALSHVLGHRLFEEQDALELEDLTRYAEELGLDLARFETELLTGAHRERVREDFRLGARGGVNGTPSFFINGTRYDGLRGLDPLLAALNEARR